MQRSALPFAIAAALLVCAGAMPAQACSDRGSSNCGASQSWRSSYDEPVYDDTYLPRDYGYTIYRDSSDAYTYRDDDYDYGRDVDISNFALGR